MKNKLPLILALLLAIAAYFYFTKGKVESTVDAAEPTVTTQPAVVPAESAAATDLTTTSPLGHSVKMQTSASGEEGAKDTEVFLQGKSVAVIKNARAVSFSPNGQFLLLAQSGADDDLQHFVIDLQQNPVWPQTVKPFGGRYVESAEWSKDSQSVTLNYVKDLAEKPTATFGIKDFR